MSALLDKALELGLRVKVTHRRPVETFGGFPGSLDEHTRHELDEFNSDENGGPYLKFCAKGGTTRVEVETGAGRRGLGFAFCSAEDNFNRRVGVDLALKRALQELGLGEVIAQAYRA